MTPRGETKTHKFTMLMTEDERSQLEALAEAERRSAADWIRIAITDAYRARFEAKKKPKK